MNPNSDFHKMGKDIQDEFNAAKQGGPAGETLYRQVEREKYGSPDAHPNTDGSIAELVMMALQRSDGSPESIASAVGDDTGTLAEELRNAPTPAEQAQVIDNYMTYASPGVEELQVQLEGKKGPEPVEAKKAPASQ